jgi:hypothetical protein
MKEAMGWGTSPERKEKWEWQGVQKWKMELARSSFFDPMEGNDYPFNMFFLPLEIPY